MLKTRVAHGYCSRQLAAEACPYANICEQCDNYVTAPEFIPQLQAQLADITALRDDAAQRGWHTKSPGTHASSPVSRLTCNDSNELSKPDRTTDILQGRLIERWFGLLTDKLIRRGVHTSVQALENDIRDWIATWNDNPRPFTWTKTADEILSSLADYLAKIGADARINEQD